MGGPGDVEVTGGGYRRPWWLYGIVGLIVVGVVVAVALRLSGPAGPAAAGPSAGASATAPGHPSPGAAAQPGARGSAAPAPPGAAGSPPRVSRCSVDLPGPAIRGADRAGSGLNRWDCRAVLDGPWAWTLRDSDSGSFGHHGAVVTFPIDGSRPDLTLPGQRQGIGWWTHHQVVVRVGERYAQVRGDVGHARLEGIARGLRLDPGGRLRVVAPPGLEVVRAMTPYRSPLVREVRYGARTGAEAQALGGGLVYANVREGAEFEDELYVAALAQPGGRVHGHPAVFSGVGGGNLTLAWEPRPGLVALVGYSGGPPDSAAKQALRRVANRFRLIRGCEWHRHVARVDDVSSGG